MSKFFHLAKMQGKTVRRRKQIIPSMKINIKTINIVAVALIVVIGVSYLVQINSFVTKSYQIKELEQKIDSLKQARADLDLESLNLQSMGAVKDKIDELGMVLVSETDYLNPTPVAVAR